MIPKIIHYCWFGGNPLPRSAEKYIESWRRYLPGYEIKRWDESNFDVNSIPYTAEAYATRKYAFVSDYARYWILYNYGGLYFDTDVEVIKPLDDIIAAGAFMGVESQNENTITVAPGLGLGTEPGTEMYKRFLDLYSTLHFVDSEGNICLKNIVEITTELLMADGLKNTEGIQCCSGQTIYPKDYFCPIDYETRELKITENTRTIHHYAESWLPTSTRIKNAVGRMMGRRVLGLLVRIKKTIKGNA